ncbi:uncharacterized protein LOC116260158 isoform X1 [Nymphaea colorata]|nr:uncharacterized protein LOC116260158 isoform X1 [Nymphaea colorata]
MTCRIESIDAEVLVYKLQMEDGNGPYIRLGYMSDPESQEFGRLQSPSPVKKACAMCWWIKVVSICLCLLLLFGAFIIWAAPLLIQKVVIPILNWETATFRAPTLGLLLFASIAICPALLLPSSPCMWLAGITFGYGYGFLLIMAGASIGMSLPYFIGSLFRENIHRWLERWPKRAALVRLAGEGSWFDQFRAVTLLRISPFPYIIFNYAVVATNVKYCPYICGSLVGIILEVFLTIYSGILIRTVADASNERYFLSLQQIIYNCLGLCAAMAATVTVTIYSRRALQTLQPEEDMDVLQ